MTFKIRKAGESTALTPAEHRAREANRAFGAFWRKVEALQKEVDDLKAQGYGKFRPVTPSVLGKGATFSEVAANTLHSLTVQRDSMLAAAIARERAKLAARQAKLDCEASHMRILASREDKP